MTFPSLSKSILLSGISKFRYPCSILLFFSIVANSAIVSKSFIYGLYLSKTSLSDLSSIFCTS